MDTIGIHEVLFLAMGSYLLGVAIVWPTRLRERPGPPRPWYLALAAFIMIQSLCGLLGLPGWLAIAVQIPSAIYLVVQVGRSDWRGSEPPPS